MYYLHKIVGWCLSPLGILFIGLMCAAIIRRRHDRQHNIGTVCWGSRWIVSATLALTWGLGCGITTRFVGAGLESAYETAGRPHGDIASLPNADAIVVLGGGMGVHAKCGAAEMYGSADRVWTGARLWKAGKAPVMTLSGGDVEASTVPLLQDFGVDKEALRYFSDARNTEEEARLIEEELVKSRGNGGERPRIILVTSAWHMPRAKMLFERVGFEVVPAPTDFEMSAACERGIGIGDFFPNCEALSRNSWAIKEWVARFCYWLKG